MTQNEMLQAGYDIIYLINCMVNKRKPDQERLTRMDLAGIYKVSSFHNLAAVVYKSILLSGNETVLNDELCRKWKEKTDKATRKNILLDIEREELFDFCEKNKIWYLPLKGVILKDYYPQDGMRQMADNDILFDSSYREEIYQWFIGRGYEAEYGISNHDCYYKEPVYNFEMHVSLFGNTHEQVWMKYYEDVKERLCRDKTKQYLYHFTPKDFYIYLICHAYKHYNASGTGIRTLLDFYMYLTNEAGKLDWNYIREETGKLGVAEFEEEMRVLCKKLFAETENFQESLTDKERKILESIILSGTYGTKDQSIRRKLAEISSDEECISLKTKCIYWKQRAFPDSAHMEVWTKMYSPFLNRHHCYGMLAKVWRIIYVIFRKKSVVWDEWKILRKYK